MADYSKYYEAREVVTRILEQDFIGPVTKDPSRMDQVQIAD